MNASLESARERLLFAQAIYEYGNSDWARVRRLLNEHPLLQTGTSGANSVTEEECADTYVKLMNECELDASTGPLGPHAAIHLELARKFYRTYTETIRAKLQEDEARFRDVAAEIDEIRAGLWDAKIKAEIQNLSVPTEPYSAPSQPLAESSNLQAPKQDSEVPEVEMQEAETSPAEVQNERTRTPSPIPASDLRATTPPLDTNRTPTPPPPTVLPESADLVATSPQEQEIPELPAVDNISPDLPSTPQPEVDKHIEPDRPPQGQPPQDQPPQDQPPQVEPIPDVQVFGHESPISPEPEPLSAMPEEKETQDSPKGDDMDIQSEDSRQASPLSPIEMESRSETRAPDTPAPDTPTPAPTPLPIHTTVDSERRPSPAVNRRKRRFSEMNAAGIDQMPESKRPREDSEPMEEEVPSTRRGRAGGPTKNFKSVINLLHAQISQHRSGNIFHNPIKKSEAPDYYDIVKRPMDLKTVKARIKDNSVTNSQEFQRDIYLMFVNAMMYNRPRSDIFKMAEEMLRDSEVNIQSFRQTEGWRNA